MSDKPGPSKSTAIQSGFNTLAFVDIETTDLGEKAEIWQLCIVAVEVDDFLEKEPPVGHKSFNRFYNPLAEIHTDVVRLTGMTNEKLKDERPIDCKARKELKEFIDGLEPPICLIAHYGIDFDFPVLKRDFGESFPASIKVVDSIDLFMFHQSFFTIPGSVSFKLKEVHKRFFGAEPAKEHEASCDVQTLIKCLKHVAKCSRMLSYEESLMKCVNQYCKSFETIGKVSRDYGRKAF